MKKISLIVFMLIVVLTFSGCSSSDIDNMLKEDNLSHEVTKEYDKAGTHYIEGTVKNNSDKEYSYLQIEFVCYDKSGNNIGTALANTNNLLGNETWKFKAMGLFSDAKAAKCEFKEVTGW